MARVKAQQPRRLPEKLKAIRERLSLLQDEMYAELRKQAKSGVKLHRGYISLYETGKRLPSFPVVLAYAKVAGISMEAFVDDEVDLN